MSRAYAHGTTPVTLFEDPTALTLLPEEARARVERARLGRPSRGLKSRLGYELLKRQSKMMVARTVAIDEAVRGAHSPQVVILGAGLDGRAWRMPELAEVDVLEVDHPDTQRDKRARVTTLTQRAKSVTFVAVDFVEDSLGEALAKAGHDVTRPTTWIWEGVVMYLTLAEIEASLEVIAQRSAVGSRVTIAYHRPAPMLKVVGLFLRRLGEPIRSAFMPEAMRALLAKYGFEVVSDDDIPSIAASLNDPFGDLAKRMKHLRIVTADRRRATLS